ncbi:MAG: oligosaccharide flippase family protein [Alphaproteobacteria bacterium]|nr:oligosaccharide flippase family protein [Alphaproteobacteria bacterium]
MGRFLPASLRTPMTRNGLALMLSVVLTSGLGVVFWAVAARLYGPEQLGLGSALISSMLALSSIAQLNLDNVINRFLPEAGSRSAHFVLSAYGVCLVLAVIGGAAFIAVIGTVAPALRPVLAAPWAMAWFVLSVALWSIFALQDIVLASLQKSLWVPVENAVYAIGKVVLLPVCAGLSLSGFSLFAVWTLPLPFLVASINALVFGRFLCKRPQGQASPRPQEFHAAVRMMGWDYAGRLASMVTIGVIPIVIVAVAGGAESAKYHLAWTMAYSIFLIGNAMARSMLAAASAEPERLPELAAEALVWTMIPVLAAAAILLFGSHLVMAIFGSAYTGNGSTTLKVLAIDSVLSSPLALYLSVARARNHFGMIAVVEIATLVLVLVMVLTLLPAAGIAGVGLAWLIAHLAIWSVILVHSLRPSRRDSTIKFLNCVRASIRIPRTFRRAVSGE